MCEINPKPVKIFVKNIKGSRLGTMHVAQTKRPLCIDDMQSFGKKIIKNIKKITKKLAKIDVFLAFLFVFLFFCEIL